MTTDSRTRRRSGRDDSDEGNDGAAGLRTGGGAGRGEAKLFRGVIPRALIDKMNGTTRSALDAAIGFCSLRTHYEVEVEHYVLKLLDATDNDAALVFRHFGLERSRLQEGLTDALEELRSGNPRKSLLSSSLVTMFVDAWTIGSLEYGATALRTGHMIVALFADEQLRAGLLEASSEFDKIDGDKLRRELATIVAESVEERSAPVRAAPAAPARGAGGKTPNLDQFTVDLTERAQQGKIDPVLGRDAEIRQVVDILTRRRQNNPILVGEAGVGKTAIVEGFALRIAQGDVPPVLRDVTLRTLDLALLQAGAGVKGEFENRLKGLIEEVRSSPSPIILFIDEAHTMIGAGGQAGQGDVANLLKPALARGELRTIAATTWAEYKKSFEKDPALERRFQPVKVEEPSEEQCLIMMRGVVPTLEVHHGVRVLDDALDAAVRLSHRYLPDRQLPDKAVSVLDTACARLALGQNSTPPAVEDASRQLEDLATQTRVLEREQALGADHAERLGKITSQREEVEARLAVLRERWEKERALAGRMRELRERIELLHAGRTDAKGGPDAAAAADAPGNGAGRGDDPAVLRGELGALTAELDALQGGEPLVRVSVDAGVVGDVISGWTGIPVGKMLRDELATVLGLEQHLGERIIGQDHALEIISHRVRTSRIGMEDPNKPVGVFLLIGPSGVGKTETALALSDLLYGGERNLITINMSEYKETHGVSTLKGAPPGYVGYGEGGVLTEAVRRRPYSVVLLDEVEKAKPEVLEIFFQVFDKGMMEDAAGRQIDFKNTIIILTTNAGTDTMMRLFADPETMPSPDGMVRALKPELDGIFRPAFLGRMVIIPYYPVRDEVLRTIVRLKLGKIQRRIHDTHGITLHAEDDLIAAVADRCTEVESGARNVDNVLTNTLLPDVSRLVLAAMANGQKPSGIRVRIGEGGAFAYETEVPAEAGAGAPATAAA